MTKTIRQSNGKVMLAGISIILGRILFVSAFTALCLFSLYSNPQHLWLIVLILCFGVSLFALASKWLIENSIKTFISLVHQSLAISSLIILFSIVRVTFSHKDFSLLESISAIVCLVVLISYFLLFKKDAGNGKMRKSRQASKS